MCPAVETMTPPGSPAPIGPYSHIAKVGDFITIGGVAGVNPASGQLAGADIRSQTVQILASLEALLAHAGSDLDHVMHVNVFLLNMADFQEMNQAYIEFLGARRPARTVIGVAALPKTGALLTMNLTAVVAD